MIGKLTMRLSLEPRALQRVLTTVGRRGYRPLALLAKAAGSFLEVDLEVEGPKPVEQLARHLERLQEARRVHAIRDAGDPCDTLEPA